LRRGYEPAASSRAVYGEYQITVEIETGTVTGDFPRRALRLIEEWRKLHQEELLENWNLSQAGFPGHKIDPLE